MSEKNVNYIHEVNDMKKTDIILLSGLIGAIIFSNFASFKSTLSGLEKGVLRMHILANSDSEEDQQLKLKVRDRLLECSDDLFGGCDTLDKMKKTAAEKIDDINAVVYDVIKENGFDYGFHTEIANMNFDERVYGDITMPAGNYDALRITLGEAKGHNWWCVMYPPLCIPAAEDVTSDEKSAEEHFTKDELDIMKNPENYRVKFKCVEVFNNIKKKIDKIQFKHDS